MREKHISKSILMDTNRGSAFSTRKQVGQQIILQDRNEDLSEYISPFQTGSVMKLPKATTLDIFNPNTARKPEWNSTNSFMSSKDYFRGARTSLNEEMIAAKSK